MEAVCSLKRQRPTAYENCLICQDDRNDKLCLAHRQDLRHCKRLHIQGKVFETGTTDARSSGFRLCLTSEPKEQVFWHKSCYATFTSKERIKRLQKNVQVSGQCSSQQDCVPSTSSGSTLRSSTSTVDWNACIFCQDSSGKGSLCSVTTFNMS
ncbi:hypothetical protein ACOMHN_022188 [Nucella lapillus]